MVTCLTVLAWYFCVDSSVRELYFYGIVLTWSALARFPGSWAGARIGAVARHAVGWFTAFVTAGGVILILNFVERPESLSEDYQGGLGAAAWIFGFFAATFIEIFTSAVELFLVETK